MKMHKIADNGGITVCGLIITNGPPNFPVTDDPEKVTCPECFEQMGGVISKENKSGTYTSLPIQPWHFAEVNSLSFLEGCIVKRVCRHKQKDGVKDLDKAIDEIEKLKEYRYNQ
jgi:hypothetical protein